jgi:ABC-type uncharacterized transport system auxiliary subunit
MNNRKIAFLLLCVGILGGCGAARPNKYYQLTIPGDSASAAPAATNGLTLVVGPFVATHLYKEDQIVYSTSSEEIGTYEYQRWAEPPAEMIGEVVLRQLRASGQYKAVYTQRSDSHGDYLLRGRLYDFKEMSGGNIVGRLTAEWELKDLKTGTPVWSHYYTHDEPVGSKDVPAVVAALDRNVQRAVTELRAGLDQYFASVPPAK